MFESEVPMRFNKIEPRKMVKDDREMTLVEIELEVSPFTAELAKELDDYVRRVLFTSTDGEVTQKLRAASFALTIQPQAIDVRMAPDQEEASYHIDEAKVLSVVARRGKKSSAWRLHVRIQCSPSSEHQLAQIFECYTLSRFLTFETTQPDLFSEKGKERARARKGTRTAAASEAAATSTAH